MDVERGLFQPHGLSRQKREKHVDAEHEYDGQQDPAHVQGRQQRVVGIQPQGLGRAEVQRGPRHGQLGQQHGGQHQPHDEGRDSVDHLVLHQLGPREGVADDQQREKADHLLL